MIDSLKQLRKDADMCTCTQREDGEGGFDTVWMTKSALLDDLDAIEREVEINYIELPKDADGMVTTPADNMVGPNGEQFRVSSIELLASGEWLVYGKGKLDGVFAKLCHHRPLTAEDVLLEFFDEYDTIRGNTPDENKVLAKFAARLQLKEAE